MKIIFFRYIDHEDWVWWHETVPKKLAELHKNGYRLIIFTNQAGIEKLHTKLDDIKRKCEKLIEETNAPIYVFIATGENHFRKPATSMYDFFVENCNQNVEVSDERFYSKKIVFLSKHRLTRKIVFIVVMQLVELIIGHQERKKIFHVLIENTLIILVYVSYKSNNSIFY